MTERAAGRYRQQREGPYRGAVAIQVIVLNGGSSSGKSGIARCLQAVLPDPWLAFGVDTLVQAMPASLTPAEGIEVAADGRVIVGPEFRRLEAAWIEGIAAMAQAALGSSRTRSSSGAQCPSSGGSRRSARCRCCGWASAVRARSRRAARWRGVTGCGMAVSQAGVVHQGVAYDLQVDTTHAEALECARLIAARVR